MAEGDGKKKRGLSPERKAECRTRYEQGESVASLSRAFRTRRHTIAGWIAKEGWTVQVGVQVDGQAAKIAQKALQSKVVEISAHAGFHRAEESGAIEALAAAITAEARSLEELAEVRRDAVSYMREIVRKAKNGEIVPPVFAGEQTEADIAATVMSAFKTLDSTVRDDLGLKSGQPTQPKENDEKPTEIKFTIVRAEQTGTEG